MAIKAHSSHSAATSAGSIKIVPLPRTLGAEIQCGDVRELGDRARKAIHQAYLDHLVLLFRDQTLDDHALMEFGRCFGKLAEPISSAYRAAGVKDTDETLKYISVISNVVENGVAIGALGDGEAAWHSDFSFHDVPYSATLLHSLEIPRAGGNTGFLNMYIAYETLPERLKKTVQGKTIKNDASHNSAGQLRKGFKEVTDVTRSPGPSHPIVFRHPETGRDALYLGRRPYAYINALPVGESEQLLDELWAHATQERFSWHHEWRVGDILVWDNRCTMHHRDPFDPASRRVMHKTACEGSRPKSSMVPAPPHPRGYAQAVHSGDR